MAQDPLLLKSATPVYSCMLVALALRKWGPYTLRCKRVSVYIAAFADTLHTHSLCHPRVSQAGKAPTAQGDSGEGAHAGRAAEDLLQPIHPAVFTETSTCAVHMPSASALN